MRTSLHLAAVEGHKDVLQLLLTKGADVRNGDNEGRTALFLAASGGHQNEARLLLQYKADVDELNSKVESPVEAAASGGHGAVVELLLRRGTKRAKEALLKASNDSVVWAFADVAVSFLKVHCSEALEEAARRGRLSALQALLAFGIRRDESPALYCAAAKGHTSCVAALLQAGFDVNKTLPNWSSRTALHFAAEYGHADIVRLLLSKGADPTIKNVNGQTAAAVAKNDATRQILNAPRT